MKNYLLLLIVNVFCFQISLGQRGMWTWVNGDTTMSLPPVLGTQGIPDSLNHPSGAYEGCAWTDKQGNFWFFESLIPTTGWDNDLWKYNPITNIWTWMKGPGGPNNTGSYGVQGIPASTNLPPCRGFGIASWTDTTGNFWMYGGCNNIGGPFNTFSDLWNFNIATNDWTWINGPNLPNQLPVYGIQGIPSVTNSPGSRMELTSTWVDNNNNLWLFGGEDDNTRQHNDLWKYDISSNEWTWMKGSDTLDSPGFYGIQGVPNTLNIPSARNAYSKWKDPAGNFWMFGGWTRYMPCPIGNAPYFNDMWRYDIGNNQWTWMNGPDFPCDVGSGSPVCFDSSGNLPISRMESKSCWTDNNGDFWMFGGLAVDTSITSYAIWLNDMWKYSLVNHEWKLIWSDTLPNQHGNFGIKGVTSPCNRPLGRMGSVSWYESNTNSMFLFGGYQYDIPGNGTQRSEMWRYDFDTTCFVYGPCSDFPSISFTAFNFLCPGTCTDFTNLSSNASDYQWSFYGATPDTSTAINPQNICYPNSGSYDVQLIATNANGSDTLMLANYITVYPPPPPQSITQSGDTLFANPATTYQWYFNGIEISGATNYFYVLTDSGDYNVICTDSNGCEVEAAIFDVHIGIEELSFKNKISAYPNPAGEFIIVKSKFLVNAKEIFIYNLLGERVLRVQLSAPGSLLQKELDIRALPSGIYYIDVVVAEKNFWTRFAKQK